MQDNLIWFNILVGVQLHVVLTMPSFSLGHCSILRRLDASWSL